MSVSLAFAIYSFCLPASMFLFWGGRCSGAGVRKLLEVTRSFLASNTHCCASSLLPLILQAGKDRNSPGRPVCVHAQSLQSCPTQRDLWTAAHQAPPSMGFSRQEHWSGVPSPSSHSPAWKSPPASGASIPSAVIVINIRPRRKYSRNTQCLVTKTIYLT